MIMHRIKILISKHFLGTLWALVAAIAVARCGIPLGGGGSLNDPAPTGASIIYSGPFFAGGGASGVSGAAEIYNTSPLTLRLDSITLPSDSGLQVLINSQTGSNIFVANLRGTSGNQNYALNTSGPFISVVIHNPTAQTNIATANLTQSP